MNELSPKIERLAALGELSLSNNKLESIPREIGQLPMLRRLYLNHNELKNLPDTLSENVLLNRFSKKATKEDVLATQGKSIITFRNTKRKY